MNDTEISIRSRIHNIYENLLYDQNIARSYFISDIDSEPSINPFRGNGTLESRLWEKINMNLFRPVMIRIEQLVRSDYD